MPLHTSNPVVGGNRTGARTVGMAARDNSPGFFVPREGRLSKRDADLSNSSSSIFIIVMKSPPPGGVD